MGVREAALCSEAVGGGWTIVGMAFSKVKVKQVRPREVGMVHRVSVGRGGRGGGGQPASFDTCIVSDDDTT